MTPMFWSAASFSMVMLSLSIGCALFGPSVARVLEAYFVRNRQEVHNHITYRNCTVKGEDEEW